MTVLKQKKLSSAMWLISCSDLFFILVSFFVLRHELIEYPKISEVHGVNYTGTELIPINKSVYESYPSVNAETLEIPIYNDWFTGEKELSLKGATEINSIKSIINSTKTQLSLNIYAVQNFSKERLIENTLNILDSISNNSLIITDISIKTTKEKSDINEIGILKINFSKNTESKI